jgi:hypothetical protein
MEHPARQEPDYGKTRQVTEKTVMDDSSLVPNNRLLLCINVASQDKIQMAFDYWAGSIKDGEWVWGETVKEIAGRYNLKDSPLIRKVRETATAFDLSTRCSSADHRIPRALRCRGEFRTTPAKDFVCEECWEQLRQQRFREEEERAKVLLCKKRAFLASLISRTTPFDYASISYADAVLAYSIMLASSLACESGRLERNAFRLCPSDAMNESVVTELFTKGILSVRDDSPLDCIEVLERGIWKYEVSRINWRMAEDSRGLPFSEVFGLLGDVIDQRKGHGEFDAFVRAFWWKIAVDDALYFLISEIRKFRFPEYHCSQKTERAVRYALEFYSIPQVRNLIRRAVGYAAQLSVSRKHYGQHPFTAIPGLIISNVDRAQSSDWNIYPVHSRWEDEPLLTRVFFDRVLRNGLRGFRETHSANLPIGDSAFSPQFSDEAARFEKC